MLQENLIITNYILGMCYHFLDTILTWEDAREECKYMSGYGGDGDLASINSFREQEYIQGNVGRKA